MNEGTIDALERLGAYELDVLRWSVDLFGGVSAMPIKQNAR